MKEDEKANLPVARQKLSMALEAISAKLTAIQKVTDTPFKTSGMFRSDNMSSTMSEIPIQKIRSSEKILDIYAYMVGKESAYNQATEELNLETIPVAKHQKYPITDWKHDLKIRLAVVSQHEQTEQLQKAKSKLESFLTEEDQLAITLHQLGFADDPVK